MPGDEFPVFRHDPRAEFGTAEGCRITELRNSPEDPACSIARARVAPGETTRWHRLEGIVERYVILEGTGRVELGTGVRADVGPLDVVTIAAGVPQRIANTGAAELVFLCVCTPRFRQSLYEELKDEEGGFRA